MVDNDQVSASLNRFGHRVSGHGQTGHDAVDFGPRIPGKQAHIEAQLRAPMARRGQKLIKDKIDMYKNNAQVLGGAPIVQGVESDEADRDAALEYVPVRRGEIPDDEIADYLQDDAEPQDDDLTDLFT